MDQGLRPAEATAIFRHVQHRFRGKLGRSYRMSWLPSSASRRAPSRAVAGGLRLTFCSCLLYMATGKLAR